MSVVQRGMFRRNQSLDVSQRLSQLKFRTHIVVIVPTCSVAIRSEYGIG